MSNEQNIRELAYQIWEAEGRPEGQQDRHWSLAYKLTSHAVRPASVAPATRVSRSRPRATDESPARRSVNGQKKTEQPR